MKHIKYEIGKPHRIMALTLGLVFTLWGVFFIYFGGINPSPELFVGQNMMGVVTGCSRNL